MKRLLLPLLLLLSACQPLAPRVEGPADLEAWQARQAWVREITDWSLEGRAAIAAGNDGWNASIDWVQLGEHLSLKFSGPLGVGSASIEGTPEAVEVLTGDGERFFTRDPEADLYWQLGWIAPIAHMPYWVRGIPGPGEVGLLEIDAAGRLLRMEQDGWEVEYDTYRLLEGDRALPRKLEMRRGDVRIRLVVSQWKLLNASGSN